MNMRVGSLKKHEGFTVLELMTVVTVIAILVVIGTVAFNGVTQRAIDNALISEAQSLAGLQAQYGARNNTVGVPWYSGDGSNADITFVPSEGNIFDANIGPSGYCIRGFNERSNRYDGPFRTYTLGSSPTACDNIPESEGFRVAHPRSYTWTLNTAHTAQFIEDTINVSRDGQRISTLNYVSPRLAISNNQGTSWTIPNIGLSQQWSRHAISDNGQVIVVSAVSGNIRVSQNGGSTWTTATGAGSRTWLSLAMSGDGQRIVAGSTTGIFVSLDGGNTWQTRNTPSSTGDPRSMVISKDGGVLVLARTTGNVFVSRNMGQSWATVSSIGSRAWNSLAISNDGKTIYATALNTNIYVSRDSGGTWTDIPSTNFNWTNLSMSSNQSVLVGTYGGQASLSFDQGATWQVIMQLENRNWLRAGLSVDGNTIFIAGRADTTTPSGTVPYLGVVQQ